MVNSVRKFKERYLKQGDQLGQRFSIRIKSLGAASICAKVEGHGLHLLLSLDGFLSDVARSLRYS